MKIRTTHAAAAALMLLAAPALAQVAPNLGSTATYGVVSSTFTNGPNVGAQTAINGDVCFTTPPVTPPISITGTTTTPCPPATGIDQTAAIAFLNGQPCTFLGAGAIALDTVVIGANPPGVIPPGCYFSGGAMDITATTTVTLSGAGVYIFRPGGALTTGANSLVTLAGGACAGNVFWAPIGATTLGANAAATATPTFVGTILDAAGITIGNFANLQGRALAFGGTVTTAAVTITVPAPCAGAFPGGPTAVPTLSEWAMILLAAMLAMVGYVAMRKRAA
jgi:hypothetical protein